MTRTGWLAVLLLIVAPWTCLGQGGFGGRGGMGGGMGGMGGMGGGMLQKELEDWTVKLDTFGNQSVTGKLRLTSVAVQCELGTYEIKPEKIKAIEFAAPEAGAPEIVSPYGSQRKGTVITSTGEKVAGVISVPSTWQIETDLGTLTPDAKQLRTFTFVAKVPAVAHKTGQKVIIFSKPDSPPDDNKPKGGGQPESGQPEKPKKPGEAPLAGPEKSS